MVPVIRPCPFPVSVDITVVGFVLAAPDRKVRKSETMDDEEREGLGEGGDVGGRGLIEASSSASRAGDFFVQVESAVIELRSESMLRAAEGEGKSWSSLRMTALATGAVVGTI